VQQERAFTFRTVSVLESVVLRSFGPEGGQVLFTRDTGQAMLSRSGIRILSALRLEHPLARMVVECVLKHSSVTGDGSKTFVLLLASLLRMIYTMACKKANVSRTHNTRDAAAAATARRLADELLTFASKELEKLIVMGVVPYGYSLSWDDFTAVTRLPCYTDHHCVQKLLASFFHTRLSASHCDIVTNLTCDLLTRWKFKNDQPSSSLQFVNDNFPALHTCVLGFSVTSSHLIEGQVIHKDFATPCPHTDNQPVKAVVFTGYLEPNLIVQFKAWAERSLSCVIANLQRLGVSVLLSAVKQSAAVLTVAQHADMCVVECIDEDELSLFSILSSFFVLFHRYVHVSFNHLDERDTFKPCSLVICGPGEGQTDQYACAFQDAVRMLLSTWEPTAKASKKTLQSNTGTSLHTNNQMCSVSLLEPGCVISAGGTFEFLLNHVLLQHGRSRSVSDGKSVAIPEVSQLLADALLSVPRQIYSHRMQCFLQTQARLLKADTTSKVFMLKLGLESVSCKYRLFLAVLQCVSSLLQVDTVLHTQSHRLKNISWEGSDDEADV
uniref:Bardet-Biedl syndrome 10 n=1 Tax=Mola mola TaxID=94237 RepID=A0A3Q4B0F9_MOLML